MLMYYESSYQLHPDAILVLDLDERIAYVNASASRIMQLIQDQLIGKSIANFVNPYSFQIFDRHFQMARSGKTSKFHWKLDVALDDMDFEPRNFEVTLVPGMMNNNISSITCFLSIDATSAGPATFKSAESDEISYSFIENCSDPILLLSLDASIVLVNRAFSNLLGWSSKKLLHLHILQCTTIPSYLSRQVEEYVHNIVNRYNEGKLSPSQSFGTFNHIETIRVIDQGIEYHILLSITPIYRNGQICNWAIHLKYVTDPKTIGRQHHLNKIERSVHQEMNKLVHLNTVSQLAASISHEVRNPLTVTRGFIQLMREPDIDFGRRSEFIKLCLSELDRAESIITDYLTFAKPVIDEAECLEVGKELDYIAKVMQPYCTLHDVEYHNILPAEIMKFYGNLKKFHQALINLIKNGIEAMKDGGVMRIEAALENEESILIRISDTGEGMDTAALESLGKPFFTTKDAGTGLGTMVSFGIIHAMKGSIEVDSEPGTGTSFSIRLPAWRET
ncbi:PAS domain-containing sensor histidine kinase [Paenibacillus sp. HB172176]|uniref:PAS domain-containing sensor histidine kinase n=1 Tax=Paenibacillus sp. HB172176 TaxID=2493690 RepID=UPI00143C2693|nr:PAS domain-containing sensor histidine kinase [Paenibacillus sp. HB172176]